MRDHRGFALLSALWLMVVISIVGLALSGTVRHQRLAAINVLDEARARAAAEAGLEVVHARLDAKLRGARDDLLPARIHPLDPWELTEDERTTSAGNEGTSYRVQVRDPGAAVHLNRATEDELRRFFLALRVDFGRADIIAQSIEDWRDPDDLHRARGAEREYYLEIGSPFVPRNGPFNEVLELLWVKGMDSTLYEQAAPHFTLLGTGRINLNTAGPEVLMSLPGITESAVAALLRLRRHGERLRRLADLAPELPGSARRAYDQDFSTLLDRTTTETRELEVESEGQTDGGVVRARIHAVFVRAGTSSFVAWRRQS